MGKTTDFFVCWFGSNQYVFSSCQNSIHASQQSLACCYNAWVSSAPLGLLLQCLSQHTLGPAFKLAQPHRTALQQQPNLCCCVSAALSCVPWAQLRGEGMSAAHGLLFFSKQFTNQYAFTCAYTCAADQLNCAMTTNQSYAAQCSQPRWNKV